ncbi:hypothetical protein [Bacteroides sp. 224]|uniref:hypothetical protein n=1 Tax=Bacteroides sp. 224 TaxID=2302936 RepID=UPI0013D77371|nr:hypothetical protein [Bacteroides sp. 224]NDV66437.1 hypothetical protein [Bacteroides sp. 224]
MKTVVNVLLGLCICALVYVCYASIMGPINFEKDKKVRDAKVIARLIDIRKAQQEYRVQKLTYTKSFDTLIDFVKTGQIPYVAKEGVLTDRQLEDGLTERKAMAIINKAKQTGKWDEVQKAGLENFKRDTIWVSVLDTLYGKGFNVDSIRYVPFGNGKEFEMEYKHDTAESGAPLILLEVKTPYSVYLDGLDKQEIINLIDLQTKLEKYPGLMIGSLTHPNNNSGNWE